MHVMQAGSEEVGCARAFAGPRAIRFGGSAVLEVADVAGEAGGGEGEQAAP